MIQTVFSQVPATYERVNHVLTLGLDVAWRRRAARAAAAAGGTRWADMCTGTGEMAAFLQRLAPQSTTVHGIDLVSHMMAQARQKPEADRIRFTISDVRKLPFADQSLDLITVSFATRNLNLSRARLLEAFAEFHRVLRPSGRMINLETSQPPCRVVQKGFHLYVKLFVKAIGSRISGSKTAYAYLAHTIPRFYGAETLSNLIQEVGFSNVTYTRLLFGVAALHQGFR
jgi:demethylmenaquinone methyltransferase/2-methoxy-6-polyprenyl-1,4-benzoquinol methylase